MAKRIRDLVEALTTANDRVIEEIRFVEDNRDVENAVGSQLEQIQKIVVLEAVIGDDNVLRTAIEAEIVINNSNGEYEALTLLVEKVFKPLSYRIQEIGNAKIKVHVTGGEVNRGTYLQFKRAVTGGVGVRFTESSETPFVFLGGNGAGFGDIHAGTGVGGKFSNVWKV